MKNVGRAAVLQAVVLAVLLTFTAGGGAAQETAPQRAPTLTARQAHGIGVVVQFLDAFNAGNFRRALGSFTNDPRLVPKVAVSDCDYRHRKSVLYRGRRPGGTRLHFERGTDMKQNVKGSGSIGGLPLGLEQRSARSSDGGSD